MRDTLKVGDEVTVKYVLLDLEDISPFPGTGTITGLFLRPCGLSQYVSLASVKFRYQEHVIETALLKKVKTYRIPNYDW